MRTVMLMLATMLTACATAVEPKFENYHVSQVSSALVAEVKSPAASVDTDFLKRKVGSPANFAGKYVLTYWGCGTQCQKVAAINVETGDVFYPGDGGAMNGVCFRQDSALLIVNPLTKEEAVDLPERYVTYFYEITPNGFKELGQTRDGINVECSLEH